MRLTTDSTYLAVSPLCCAEKFEFGYVNGVPEGSRLSQSNLSWLRDEALVPERVNKVIQFTTLAKELHTTPAQLAIAWCLKNPRVSSVITGASSVEQVKENMKAFALYQRLNAEAHKAIEKIFS